MSGNNEDELKFFNIDQYVSVISDFAQGHRERMDLFLKYFY